MPVRAIQKKWALRAVLFPWEIGGYMALAVLIVQQPPQLQHPAGIRRGAARGVVCLLLQFTSVSDSQNMPHDRAKKSANREPQVPSRKFGAFYAQE